MRVGASGDLLCVGIKSLAQFLDAVVVNVLFVIHEFVNGAIRCEFDNAIGNRVDELVVVACEENISLEEFQVVVKSLNAFHIQMVRRCVEYQAVGVA